jgi:hypothetical protein
VLIRNKVIDEEKITELISKIKSKKELNQISDDFVKNQLFSYLQQKPKAILILDKVKSAKYKLIVKEIRSKLRGLYGQFRSEDMLHVRRDFMEQFKLASKVKRKKILDEILKTHSSTKERLDHYDLLYRKIFAVVGKPKVILDLGAGINPLSFSYMNLRSVDYYAYDLSHDEINLLNDYFFILSEEKKNFFGKAEVLDLLHLADLPKADLCFLLKMTDVLDRGKGHKMTELVIKNIQAKFVVVSFPTFTMSGKKMNFPKRKWFELMCRRLVYSFNSFKFNNELFYIIKK